MNHEVRASTVESENGSEAMVSPAKDYQRVEQALRYIAVNYKSQPDLAEIAASVHLSEAHFQRVFKRWAGVTPKQFLQYLTLEHARQCLRGEMSVLDTTFDCGLAAPARLNELFVRIESVTPSEFKHHGLGINIDYGFHETAFGCCLLGVADRGVTGIEFCSEPDKQKALVSMQNRLPEATFTRNDSRTAEYRDIIFGSACGCSNNKTSSLSVLVRGTPFQIKVWEALLRIPSGSRVSYGQIAATIDRAGANRAVGTAVGKNPVAVLIPCHRVIREDGKPGGYHWGLERKFALLGAESLGAVRRN